MKIINIGVLGCANIAVNSVIPTILEVSNCFKLGGIASRKRETVNPLVDQFRTKAYIGYQSLVDDIEIDAVYIPLPNSLHAEWIEKALQNGKHVLVEKPLACDVNDVIKLNKLAEEKGLALVENFQFRFHHQLGFIKDLVKNGIIGELRCLRSSFGFNNSLAESDIRFQKQLGGGALLDTGAYPIKIAQIFLGQDIEVKASNLNFIEGKEVDMFGGAYVKQKNGSLFGELAFGFDNQYQCSIEIWGSRGRIFTNRIFTAKKEYKPEIEIETVKGKETIFLEADHHFKNMLLHFHELICNMKGKSEEYMQNINQARLMNELKIKSNE